MIGVWRDGQRLFICSGAGLGRDWPQNLLADGPGLRHPGDFEVPAVPRSSALGQPHKADERVLDTT